VLVTDGKLLWVRHEASERASKGPGESIDIVDMVSKSGVPGSRYGLVVLMKVTRHGLRRVMKDETERLTMLRNVHPDGVFFECVFVCIKAF
jgi:hypothetical protein